MFEAVVSSKGANFRANSLTEPLATLLLLEGSNFSSEVSGVDDSLMAPPPGPYSGTSTLALVVYSLCVSLCSPFWEITRKWI